jgi:hypothetical protein
MNKIALLLLVFAVVVGFSGVAVAVPNGNSNGGPHFDKWNKNWNKNWNWNWNHATSTSTATNTVSVSNTNNNNFYPSIDIDNKNTMKDIYLDNYQYQTVEQNQWNKQEVGNIDQDVDQDADQDVNSEIENELED